MSHLKDFFDNVYNLERKGGAKEALEALQKDIDNLKMHSESITLIKQLIKEAQA